MLNTTMKLENGELTVILEGRLDALTSQKLEKELEEKLDGVSAITIDCAKLEYISSAGLRTILAAEQYMEEHGYGDVKLTGTNDIIANILSETGFTEIVNVVR